LHALQHAEGYESFSRRVLLVRGGRTPIHIQRWAPADYQADEHVQLLLARRDWRTLTFYRQFLDASFMAGGDLPADAEGLSACVRMPVAEVRRALEFCLGRLIVEDGGRLFQQRVRSEVAEELEFRLSQGEHGKRGGRPPKKTVAFTDDKASLSESETPPAPAPAPSSLGTTPNPLLFSEDSSLSPCIVPPPTTAKARRADGSSEEAELRWRIEETWSAHVAAWRNFYKTVNGRAPSEPPTFTTKDHGKPIREALLEFDRDLLAPEKRDEWKRRSKVRAAGVGIFYDDWCTGADPRAADGNGNAKRYLEHWRPWRRQIGKGSPIPRFAELYFEQRDAMEVANGGA
jgi:hypothetical protein